LGPKRIYTRANLDPNPPITVENPKKIFRKSSSKVGKETYQLYKSTSLPPKGVESIDEVTFDLKFKHSLFKSKSESDLSQIVLDPKLFNPITPKGFSNFSAKGQKLFWDTLSLDLKKELLIERHINSQSPKFIIKKSLNFLVNLYFHLLLLL